VAGSRAYAAGQFQLELDGIPCGFLRSVEGGAATADVVEEQTGATYYVQKHVGQPRWEDLILGLDLSLDKSVYQWIADSWTGKPSRRDGSIIAVSQQLKAVSEREFFRALLTEVTVPAMDAASKDPAHLTIKLAPEYTRTKTGSGASVKNPAARQKAWQSQNFKLEIDSLDCTKVSKIAAFTVKQTVAPSQIGEQRISTKEPTRLEVPNLRITLAESSAQTWVSWFDDFVVKGNNDSTKERSGKLSFFTPDRKTVLGEVSFFNLGIFRLEPEAQTSASEQIARLHADLYCERMELKVG